MESEKTPIKKKQKKATRGKGEGALFQRANGLWCGTVELPRIEGEPRRRVTICSKDKKVALAKLNGKKEELREHGDIPTDNMTVAQWLDYWMDEFVYPHVRPNTASGRDTVIRHHIVPAIGKVKLKGLTPTHIRKVADRITSTPKDPKLRGEKNLPEDTVMLSSTYALNAHNIMSTAFRAAVNEGRIKSNPVDKTKAPRKRLAEQKALDVDQAIKLLGYLSDKADGPQWATYLLTGARRGEILGLEADRITDVLDLSWQLQRFQSVERVPADFEYRELGNGLYLTRPKSSAGWRIIPLVDPLRAILHKHIEDSGRTGLVFTRDDGSAQDPDTVTKSWKKMLGAADLPTDVVLHGSRHTTIDLLYEAGVPEVVIMEIVGHTTRNVTRSYRSKGNRKQLEDAMKKMSALLSQKEKQLEQ